MKKGLREMVEAQRCLVGYSLSKMNLSTEKTKTYNKAVVAKNAVKEFFKVETVERESFIEKELEPLVESLMDDSLYLKISKQAERKALVDSVKRYLKWLTEMNAEYLSDGITRDLKVLGDETLITVGCDYFIKVDGKILAVLLKTGKPHLSPSGRKVETAIPTSFELYALMKLAQEVYGSGTGAMHHFRTRSTKKMDDYGDTFISQFTYSPQKELIIIDAMKSLAGKMDGGVLECNTSNCMNCRFKGICGYAKKESIDLKVIEQTKAAEGEITLTPDQRKAVLFSEGVVRVNAGAGSGKTTIIALRLNELILSGAKPENILLVTFTNKGTEEMRRKIKHWLAVDGLSEESDKVNIETFNSWGGKIIENNYEALGFSSPPKLIDKVEKYDIIMETLSKNPMLEDYNYEAPLMDFPYAKGVVVMMSQAFDYIKSQGTHSLEERFPKQTDKIIALYNEFNEILQQRNLIEYQDQIRLLTEAMENNADFLNQYVYEHVVVDEFQDSDAGQMDIVLHLVNHSKFKSLMIVGDDSQSIYGFRNTSQENILNFGDYFKEMTDIRLMENFRSTPEIVGLANAINENNKKRIKKNLIAAGKASGKTPELHTFTSKTSWEDEKKFIVESVRKEIEKGTNPEDIAIIARTRNELFEMYEMLVKEGVSAKIDVPEPLINNPLIIPIRSLLSSLENPDVTLGFANYTHILDGSILERNREEVLKSVENMKAEIEALNEMDCEGGLLKRDVFFDWMEKIQDEEVGLFLEELREQNLSFHAMKSYVDKFVEYEDRKVYTALSDVPTRAVKLITVHASKGKEYKVVYITLSKFKLGKNDDENAEERRTAFVGLTRAMDKLTISVTSDCKSKLPFEISQTKKTINIEH